MTQKINAVDIEQFRGTTFFSLTPHKWGNRAKAANASAHIAYLNQLGAEKEKAKADGQEAKANIAADGATTADAVAKASRDGKAAVTATKRLLVSKPLDEMCKFLTEFKASICGQFGIAQQSKVLKGIYVVRNELIQTVEDKIAAAQERLTAETVITESGEIVPGYLPAFLEDYPAAIERTRTLPLLEGGLGPLFDSRDYPSAENLAGFFSLDSQWLALGIPDDLPPALKAKAAERFEKQMTDAAEECKDALRSSLAQFLSNLKERLQDDPKTGKPKIFRDTLIGNVRSFCEVFDARNFLKDEALENLVNKSRAVLANKDVTPESIRKYSSIREQTRKQFEEISTELDGMIETSKGRAFDLSDD